MSRIKLTVLGFLGFILMLSAFRVSVAQAEDNNQFSWNILGDGGGINVADVALASDGSTIALAGSGTFNTENPEEVTTSGGTWTISGGGGSGTFEVLRLVQFNVAAGTFPGHADFRAGIVFLQIAYSDGDQGILVVSCNLGTANGTPANVLEGVTASKGFVNFWNVGTPHLTVFHVLPE